MSPLNEALFQALESRFPRVEIANAGEHAQVSYRPDYHRGGRLRVEVTGGEYYRVSCPFCDDQRLRLWFSHLWATRDHRTRRELLHPVTCYNERCVDSRAMHLELRDLVFPFKNSIRPPRTRPRVPENAVLANAIPIETPESVWNFTEPLLPESYCPGISHVSSPQARRYLAERGFDVAELETRWGIWHCQKSCFPGPAFSDRIVIPVHTIEADWESETGQPRIVLAGWQARAIGEVERDVPKYLTSAGMKKSRLLYALPEAVATTGPLAVVEGVTDVWRLRTNAVALFGKDLSLPQRNLLVQHFRTRPLVVFFDREANPDEEQKTRRNAEKAVRELRAARAVAGDCGRVVSAVAPPGRKDVGECHFEEAWQCVAEALGVPSGNLLAEINNSLTENIGRHTSI